MVQWIPTIIAAAAGIIGVVEPQLVATNPKAAAVLAMILGVLNHLLPSPLGKSPVAGGK